MKFSDIQYIRIKKNICKLWDQNLCPTCFTLDCYLLTLLCMWWHATAQVVRCWLLITETWVYPLDTPCRIYGVQRSTGTGYLSESFGFPHQYHSTTVPCTIIIWGVGQCANLWPQFRTDILLRYHSNNKNVA
jgi:hypothetical protein